MGKPAPVPECGEDADAVQYPELLKKIRAQQAEDAKKAAQSTGTDAAGKYHVGQGNGGPELQSQPASIRAH